MLSRIINRIKLLFPSKPRKVFNRIYEKNAWGSDESVSGPGSTLKSTWNIRQEMPALLKRFNIKIMLDLPCGDFNWMSRIDLGETAYIGGDIVPGIIEANKLKYPGRDFRVLNIIHDPLPAADLLLCKDCFIHLQNKDVLKAIENIRESGIRYLLASTYPVAFNKLILTGHYRPVNMQRPPFDLPAPVELIEDFADDGTERYLALWDMQQL
jgi:hypothetical protein